MLPANIKHPRNPESGLTIRCRQAAETLPGLGGARYSTRPRPTSGDPRSAKERKGNEACHVILDRDMITPPLAWRPTIP